MMQEYEYVAITKLHERLKEKINASIFVCINKDDELVVHINKNELHYSKSFGDITCELVGGSFADKFCDIIVKEYRRFVLSRYFY